MVKLEWRHFNATKETLNTMLDAEADALYGAQRYEHSPDRVDTRAGSYERSRHTKAGEIKIKVPKLCQHHLSMSSFHRFEMSGFQRRVFLPAHL